MLGFLYCRRKVVSLLVGFSTIGLYCRRKVVSALVNVGLSPIGLYCKRKVGSALVNVGFSSIGLYCRRKVGSASVNVGFSRRKGWIGDVVNFTAHHRTQMGRPHQSGGWQQLLRQRDRPSPLSPTPSPPSLHLFKDPY